MAGKKSSNQCKSAARRGLNQSMPDESAHESAGVEWWFVQGSFQGPSSGVDHFMCTLIRNRIAEGEDQPGDGFSLLLTLLNHGRPRAEILSRVDREMVSWSMRLAEKNRPAHLDGDFIELFSREVAKHGPPRPIEMVRSRPRLKSNPFAAEWDDFLLAQSSRGIELAFTGPQNGRRYRFQISPQGPRHRAWEGHENLTGLRYYTYPRMDLTGWVDDRKVIGQAWMDHQWGHRKSFLSNDREKCLLGWDWFGVSLEGGGECMITSFWNVSDGTPFAGQAILWHNEEERIVETDVRIEPRRRWESTATRIEYPVASRIVIPELEADLLFEPLADDQEIPVFGPMRAIWEGAGRITGTLAGRPVTGPARCELQGYGYLLGFQPYLDRFAARVHRRIAEFMPKNTDSRWLDQRIGPPVRQYEPAAYNGTIARPAWDLIERKGKCWRPAFALLMLETLGTRSEPYEELICACGELPHTGALMIDDIEDDAPIRRGEESIHVRYGTDVTINCANTLYFLPLPMIGAHPILSAGQKLELYDLTMHYYIRAHMGQALDIYWSRNMVEDSIERWIGDSLGEKILEMYVQKTGTAVMAGAEEAAIIAGVDRTLREAALTFATAFGVAFQITDDVLDFSGGPGWRKGCGSDLAMGKLTYVIYRALETMQGDNRKRLRQILCTPELRGDPLVLKEGVGLIRETEVLEECRREARTMFKTAWERFADKVPLTEPKMLLYKLCSNLVVSGRIEETTSSSASCRIPPEAASEPSRSRPG
jgi:geranylgeranyl pyrophosphate synthase/predicted secreted hydrolase